jgi:hypothetical protein
VSTRNLQGPGRARKLFARQIFSYCSLGLALAACTSVPGETLTSGGRQRDIAERVLAQSARANPQCKQRRIADTEVVELHPDAKPAVERWSVEECGRRVHYRVTLPPTGKGSAFSVRAE